MTRPAAPTHPPRLARCAPGPQAHWELLDRGPDIGVRGIGPTKAAAFEQAAVALTGVIVDPSAIDARETVTITCGADGDEMLLVEWLNALIEEMRTRGMLFSHFRVDLCRDRLVATASGERVAVDRHRLARQVKRATCTELRVERTSGGAWIAQTVVDV